MEFGRHIFNLNNIMRSSWKLINKELGKDHKNHGIQSVNVNGRSTLNHQIVTDACNKHFKSIPDMIYQNINANYCLTETSNSNEKKLSCSFKHVFQNLLPLYYNY
jgi:hypothetical protein